MLRTRPIRNQLISGINTTVFSAAMVVIVLTVLVIESAYSPPRHPIHPVELPKAAHSVLLHHAVRDDAIKITVRRDGKVFYRNERLEPSDVRPRIRQDLSQGSEKKVYLQVDMRAKYAVVKDVLDSVQSAGVQNISFFVSEPFPTPRL